MAGLAVLLIVWVICGFAGALIADSKGRNPWAWAGICLIFGLVGILVISVLASEKPGAHFQAAYAQPAHAPSMTTGLQQLSSMHARGALSAEEFAAAKARVLSGVVTASPARTESHAVRTEVEPSLRCECGARNRPNRSSCWSCKAPLASATA